MRSSAKVDYMMINFENLLIMKLVLVVLCLSALLQIVNLQSCHYTCGSCSGTLNTDCTSCIDGLYLSGSICVASCDVLADAQSKTCVYGCPTSYFQRGNFCEPCP